MCILPVYSLHTVCIMSEAWVLQANSKNKVVDPIPGMIVAINMYLQAYHMYRAAALNKPEVKSLDTMSRDALDTLQKEFPFGVRRADGTLRLYWCTEKPHSMVHWASNYRTVGRCRTISTNVTESRMKTAVKTKAKKTNNQASVGGSILKANMEVEAAVELAHDLDQTGMHCVRLRRNGSLGSC